jgi:hypothetical protein
MASIIEKRMFKIDTTLGLKIGKKYINGSLFKIIWLVLLEWQVTTNANITLS